VIDKGTNPFPGLRPFQTDEYRFFFGRGAASQELLTRLQHSRFLSIIGASGSGKSSLIQAGLIPALRGGMLAGAGAGWRIVVTRPGDDPIGNLAGQLVKKGMISEAIAGLSVDEDEAVIDATLRTGSLGLVEVVRLARLAEQTKVLIVVDQFEELFVRRAVRKTGSLTDDASAFVKLLLEAAHQADVIIYVVIVLRSEFLGDCAQFQKLPEAINEGEYLVPHLTRDQRHLAITGPIGVMRGKISNVLVTRLLNEVEDTPNPLTILQHALTRTWVYWQTHQREGEPIGIEHYEAIGTMSAISLHADEELSDERSQ
jgi:energy-coupling factor transporter ATP-binding protein EcfA2